jgi:hypothetical protein
LERAGTLVLTIEPGGDTLRALGANSMRARRVDEIEDLAYESTLALLGRPEQAGRVALLRGSRTAGAAAAAAARAGRAGRRVDAASADTASADTA